MRVPLFLLTGILVTAQTRVVPQPGIPLPDQTGTASVEGTVLDAVTREPVKRALVSLNGRIGLNAVTGASGHFAFRKLPESQYFIQANSPKYPVGRSSLGANQPQSFPLAADEQKRDVTLLLTPGAAVRGRVVDEEGIRMPHCSISAMQFQDTEAGRTLNPVATVQSDDKGEYRISNLAAGKYLVMAQCSQTIPLPHAFIRRNSSTAAPAMAYPPTFYPGVLDPLAAARVTASAGANLPGIDFRMTPANSVAVRGRVGPDPSDPTVRITLESTNPLHFEWPRQALHLNPSTGEFTIPNVLPGSYELTALRLTDGRSFFAKVPLEIVGAPPQPVELSLAAAPDVTGAISVESEANDSKMPLSSFRVMLNPSDNRMGMAPHPQAEVKGDGTFTLTSVLPGKWRLFVSGAPGYIKSVTQGDQQVSATSIEIKGAAAPPLKIVMSTQQAKVDVSLATAPPDNDQVFGFLWAASEDSGLLQNFGFNRQGRTLLTVPPGRYYACATAIAQPWGLMQNRALRKLLEDTCKPVDIAGAGSVSVQLPLITASDLKRLLEKLDE